MSYKNPNKKRNRQEQPAQNVAVNNTIDGVFNKSNEIVARPDQEIINRLKAAHGEIFRIAVGDHVAYLKKPNRMVLSQAAAIGTKDPLKFNDIILKNCWIEGDMAIQTDDSLFLSVCSVLSGVIEVQQASLEKI